MKLYISQQKTLKKDAYTKQKEPHSLSKTLETPKTTISPIILHQQAQIESGGHESQSCSMKHLCDTFLKRIANKVQCEFETKQLVAMTGVKQRRVYDLMNILQGCGYVKRISKGTYHWRRCNLNQQFAIPQHKTKISMSLSTMAAQVKKLLFQSQIFLDFKNICTFIFQKHHNHDNTLNIDSIKRRVYQCCKVFRALGLVQKNGQRFRWNQSQNEEIAFNSTNIQNIKPKRKSKRNAIQKEPMKQQKQQYDQMISQILSRIYSEQDLNIFMNQLKNEFFKKKDRKGLIMKQLKYQ